jgi:two-component SAPR family response regulator
MVARLQERWRGAHHVLITGYASEEAAVAALGLRVDDYIRKPFDINAFLERIRAVCRQRLQRRQRLERRRTLARYGLESGERLEGLQASPGGRRGQGPGRGPEPARGVDSLYRGPFLEECGDDWAEELRESTLRLASDAAVRLASHRLGSDPAAEAWARRALTLEPTCEAACALLIRALAAPGRRDEAVRTYHRCGEVLACTLDLRPGPDVTRAYLEATA